MGVEREGGNDIGGFEGENKETARHGQEDAQRNAGRTRGKLSYRL